MKGFFYDTLLDEENICNLNEERDRIKKLIGQKRRVVIYAPRNCGKTSLVKNVIIPFFYKKHPKGFVLFSDLMEVKNRENIDDRVQASFETAFSRAFPAKNLLENALKFLKSLRPEVAIDPHTGSPSLSIQPSRPEKKIPFTKIFESLLAIAKEMPTLVVLDEFQDISFVDEAQGLFRNAFQNLRDVPIVVMGSKRHILSEIFAKPDAPLAGFGEDLEFNSISYEAYHSYISERFKMRSLEIDFELSVQLQNMMRRNPEAINILCAYVFEHYSNRKITSDEVLTAFRNAVENRSSRFEQYLASFSESEEKILIAISKHEPVLKPNGSEFLSLLPLASRTVGLAFKKLYNRSIIDKRDDGFLISDPLFAHYLRQYR